MVQSWGSTLHWVELHRCCRNFPAPAHTRHRHIYLCSDWALVQEWHHQWITQRPKEDGIKMGYQTCQEDVGCCMRCVDASGESFRVAGLINNCGRKHNLGWQNSNAMSSIPCSFFKKPQPPSFKMVCPATWSSTSWGCRLQATVARCSEHGKKVTTPAPDYSLDTTFEINDFCGMWCSCWTTNIAPWLTMWWAV